MKMRRTEWILSKFRERKGSLMLGVMVLGAAMSMGVGSSMKTTLLERRMAERHVMRLDAQNSAESALSLANADLVKRWTEKGSFPSDELADAKNPLELGSIFNGMHNGTEVKVVSSEIQGGPVTNKTWTYIDPASPENQYDPLKGQYVLARNVEVVTKVEVNKDSVPHPVAAYGKSVLQVRDSPLFSYAVFYNMNLDFHNGPRMDIYGPVHTNGELWSSCKTELYFHDAVTIADRYQKGIKMYDLWGYTDYTQSGSVYYKDQSGNFLSDYKGSGSKASKQNYFRSADSSWVTDASNRWDGNVQSIEHGVQKREIMGYGEYVPDDPSTPQSNDAINPAYAILEPNLSTSDPDYKGSAGEREKIAQKAGLTIRVHDSEPSVSNSEKHQVSSNYWVTFHNLVREDPTDPFSDPSYGGSGDVQENILKVSSSFVSSLINFEEYGESRGSPTSGLYDQRRSKGVTTLELDVDVLRQGVDDTHGSYNESVWMGNTYKPEDDYNGILYVEFPYDASASGREDKMKVSDESMGLVLHNGGVVPRPSYNGTATRDEGFFVGTNNTLYVKGHFNSDGDPNTGSAVDPDDGQNPEPPAAFAADSITILSGAWDPAKSKGSKYYRDAEFTEVNAGVISGIIPTGKFSIHTQSGGVHNFMRFLEDWDGVEYRYRGSLVCLFESEIGNENPSNSYFNPPNRNWGFYSEFADGSYPPGTPVTRTFRVLSYKMLGASEYLVQKSGMLSGFGSGEDSSSNSNSGSENNLDGDSSSDSNSENSSYGQSSRSSRWRQFLNRFWRR